MKKVYDLTQRHHILYEPEWIVELTGWQHKVITHIQRLKATENNYQAVGRFLHAVTHEWNRIGFQLAAAREKNINKE